MKAPYNFVPLSDKVFFPFWSEKVGFDRPLRDGMSGEIEIEIEAKSPIIIKNPTPLIENGKEVYEFNNVEINGEKRYFIPATSFKGMLRNVLEIISFSKISFIDDNRYFFRDLRNKDFRDEVKNVNAGFLVKEGDRYFIQDLEEPGRISHKEIDRVYNVNFKKLFEDDFANTDEWKMARKKYELFRGNLINRFNVNKKICRIDKSGKEGILVFTGQPSNKKKYEFVFFLKENPQKIEVTDLMDDFRKGYFEGRDTNPKESKDWKYWREKLEKGEKVPVFFTKEGNRVKHFGLSFLYKVPYKFSVKECISKEHKKDGYDLAETIFGRVKDKDALKGRVFISHLFAVNNPQVLNTRSEILGTPRGSYYPNYLEQFLLRANEGQYITYKDGRCKIRGWKRYPIREDNRVTQSTDTGNDNVKTHFKPLREGVRFRGKIKFFNMKKSEIGALISALTFHNTKNTFHNIGLAKPLGYGKIEVKITSSTFDLDEVMKEFEKEIRSWYPEWHKSEQMIELLTMASPLGDERLLSYMELEEFAKRKNDKEYLKKYSEIVGKEIYPNVYFSEEEIEQIRAEKLEEEKRVLKEKQEKERIEKLKKEYQDFLGNLEKMDINQLQSAVKKFEKFDISEFEKKLTILKEKQKKNKFQKVNEEAKKAFERLKQKRGKKGFEKEKQKFIKKWSNEKNNKGSEFVLKLVEKASKLK